MRSRTASSGSRSNGRPRATRPPSRCSDGRGNSRRTTASGPFRRPRHVFRAGVKSAGVPSAIDPLGALLRWPRSEMLVKIEESPLRAALSCQSDLRERRLAEASNVMTRPCRRDCLLRDRLKPRRLPVVENDGSSDGFRLVLPRPGLPPQLTLLANHPQHSAKRGLVLWVVRKCRRQARTEQNSEGEKWEGWGGGDFLCRW